ncbi:T6SS amidase immunity protein Tai4 family protein [Erwinia billingiae]|uniref:T6SS amidase immunity protein Tai4 family protein n=1 Tax=Erwinia billingiae TaxID=182337 RepID=UPI0022475E22|nr:T6SS amidase immunity protein Tai4 family protein [Erwinia billingiae]MCX0501422.1 hypothetical protein [Erwinia billingiae]
MKKLIFIFLLGSSSSVLAVTPPEMDSFTQPGIFQNWLQNRCIGKISQDKKLKDDAFKSAASWLEVSHLPIDAFHKGDVLIDNYLKLKLSGSNGGEYNVLKCTFVSQSKESKAIFDKYNK